MAQVLLFSPPNFRGVITDTPSGTGYSTAPGRTIAADERDVALLLTYGFSSAAPPVSTNGTSLSIYDQNGDSVTSIGTLTFEGVTVSGTTPSGIVNMTTITGADGGTNSYGVAVLFQSGGGGTVGDSIYGGAIYFYSGDAGNFYASTKSQGGNINFLSGKGGYGVNSGGGHLNLAAGAGGYSASYAPGGELRLSGGDGGALATNGSGYGVTLDGGLGFGASGSGGAHFIYPGNAALGPAGYVQIGIASTGGNLPPGDVRINGDPSLIKLATLSWIAGETLDARTIGISIRAALVTAVIVRLDAANGAAGTLIINQCPSGTAPGAGTVLTTDSADLNGTPNANQTLTLSATLTDLQIAAGTAFCTSTTGTLTLCAGCIEVWGAPQ